ncbi:prepilin-type N-terminal cleavage/methylation domain-containing protein [Synechococcus sp. MIT S9451]|uniref:prepilin-type N-terminal cleavage/methylation domain-containing protein n=1 Tax=Synechococcus sp. MIT S9451 TaxID=3082543 RepID=UPI0039B67AA1
MTHRSCDGGFSLLECLLAITLLAILSSVVVVHTGGDRARQQLAVAAQRLQVAIDRGRLSAMHRQQACALRLTDVGLQPDGAGALPSCPSSGAALVDPLTTSGVSLHTNVSGLLRFSANGLLLDGGLVVFSHPASQHRPCVVVSLPLGVTRQGVYGADPAAQLSSSHCLPRS